VEQPAPFWDTLSGVESEQGAGGKMHGTGGRSTLRDHTGVTLGRARVGHFIGRRAFSSSSQSGRRPSWGSLIIWALSRLAADYSCETPMWRSGHGRAGRSAYRDS
jgi:hypothetical protein